MEQDMISPVRKRYDICTLLILGIVCIGAIPMGFCEKLEGFFLVYFIIYITLVISLLITLSILFNFVRKKEVEFFKNKFSLYNMEKSVSFNFEKEDNVFYYEDRDIELTSSGVKDLLQGQEYLYTSFKIYATYVCGFSGEIYKVFVNFENEEMLISLKLDNVLYSLIKFYKINVDNLESVLNECENNLNRFFKYKKTRG